MNGISADKIIVWIDDVEAQSPGMRLTDWQKELFRREFTVRIDEIMSPKMRLEKIASEIWSSDDYPHVVELARLVEDYPYIDDYAEIDRHTARKEMFARYLLGHVLPDFCDGDLDLEMKDAWELRGLLAGFVQEER